MFISRAILTLTFKKRIPAYVNVVIRKMSGEGFNVSIYNRASPKRLQEEVQSYFKRNYEQYIQVGQIQLINVSRSREKSLSDGDTFALVINEREFFVYCLPLSEETYPLQIKTRSSMIISELS